MRHSIISIALLHLLLASCTVNPTVLVKPGGAEVVTLGGSLLSKAANEKAEIITANGARLSYERTGRDETGIARYYLQAQATAALGNVAGQVSRNASNNETRRALSQDAVEQTRITAPLNAEIEKARIAETR